MTAANIDKVSERPAEVLSLIYTKALQHKNVTEVLLDQTNSETGSVSMRHGLREAKLPVFDERVGAYILAKMGHLDEPSVQNIQVVLEPAGIKSEENSLETLVKELTGTSMDDLLTTYPIKPLDLQTHTLCPHGARQRLSCCNKNVISKFRCFSTLPSVLEAGPGAIAESCTYELSCCKDASLLVWRRIVCRFRIVGRRWSLGGPRVAAGGAFHDSFNYYTE
ncbi:hypothetical protein BDU57DRAFT_241018 [Ampelomyces quisqualis]|uniref:Uncharacterized protein n=1 Tax=Ampelomyces quisqualis TaxID=50730 RepID=A0A6A5QP98_AMPQU|nr:hypothetical protein BDU57DRAFT_241018 [Ampelomyces quisqualis]